MPSRIMAYPTSCSVGNEGVLDTPSSNVYPFGFNSFPGFREGTHSEDRHDESRYVKTAQSKDKISEMLGKATGDKHSLMNPSCHAKRTTCAVGQAQVEGCPPSPFRPHGDDRPTHVQM